MMNEWMNDIMWSFGFCGRVSAAQTLHGPKPTLSHCRPFQTYLYFCIHTYTQENVRTRSKISQARTISENCKFGNVTSTSSIPPPFPLANRLWDGVALGTKDHGACVACRLHFKLFNRLTMVHYKFTNRQHAHLLRQKRYKYQNNCSAFTGHTQPHFSKPLVPPVTWKK